MFNKYQHRYNKYSGVNTIAHNDHNTELKIHGIEHFI